MIIDRYKKGLRLLDFDFIVPLTVGHPLYTYEYNHVTKAWRGFVSIL
jgi:hypothetical protein